MCKYIYCYFSTCQHGELTRVTYCNKATALGLPIHDGHSPDGVSADNTPGAQLNPSSSHPPTSSANNSSSSYSHTQYQHHTNMSTLNPSEAGTPLGWDVAATVSDEQLPRQAAFIPRSAIDVSVHRHSFASADSQLDAPGYRNLNIDIPLNTQSSLSMELTHDVSSTERTRPSIVSTRRTSLSDAGTVREPPEQHVQFKTESPTVGDFVQGQQSPRKPIPSQWLPKSSGPHLATAQRAKDRSYKKGSQSGSPTQMKTLRGTRSSVDLNKTHNTDGVTFLTKEALAAVESNIVSPTSLRSPSKILHSPSKPSSQSPQASPLRGSRYQQSTPAIKMSPTRPTYLSAEAATNVHSRASSSVTTSTGGNSFHTAAGSPVRSPAESELSFKSAAGTLEDIKIPHLDLNANSETVQAVQALHNAKGSTFKAATENKRSPIKPKLALSIPPSESSFNDDDKSAATSASVPSSSNTSVSPWSLTSPVQTSRIPRVATTITAGATQAIARSAMMKRAQSMKSLASRPEPQLAESSVSPQLQLPMPIAKPVLYSSTDKATVTTSSLSNNPKINIVAYAYNDVVERDLTPARVQSDTLDNLVLELNKTTLSEHASSSDEHISGYTSRATSTTTLKAPPLAADDPVLIDSAIIYSRKKADTFGTMLDSPIGIPPIIVMTAHTFHLGTLPPSDSHNETVLDVSYASASSIRGRTEHYVPNARKQSESEPSIQSSLGSDLRATAPEFVPQAAQQPCSVSFLPETVTLAQPDQATTLPDLSSLDQHGIPWFYYMYPVHFAYEQGFRNGRSRSPKKFKPRKQRGSVSSPTDAQNSFHKATVTDGDLQPVAAPLSWLPQRRSSAELMSPPAAPQEPTKRENSNSGLIVEKTRSTTPRTDAPSAPFSTQIDRITEQAALRNHPHSNTTRFANMDITTIRNVGLPQGPRNLNAATHYTVPYRGQRYGRRFGGNGLYSGRGAAGVPMHATVPFPEPVPPQGHPLQNHLQFQGGSTEEYMEYSVGKEACGMVHIDIATEKGGGNACNACEPDH